MKLSFVIPGSPVAKARARVFYNKSLGRAMAYTPTKTASYENFIKLIAAQEWPHPPMTEPIHMSIKVYRSTPKSLSNKKVNLAELGHIRPTSKPDCDNYLKSICDALNNLVFKDDSQVVSVKIEKFYSAFPRTEIEIEGIENTEIDFCLPA